MNNSFYDPKISINESHLQVVFSVKLGKPLWVDSISNFDQKPREKAVCLALGSQSVRCCRVAARMGVNARKGSWAEEECDIKNVNISLSKLKFLVVLR